MRILCSVNRPFMAMLPLSIHNAVPNSSSASLITTGLQHTQQGLGQCVGQHGSPCGQLQHGSGGCGVTVVVQVRAVLVQQDTVLPASAR